MIGKIHLVYFPISIGVGASVTERLVVNLRFIYVSNLYIQLEERRCFYTGKMHGGSCILLVKVGQIAIRPYSIVVTWIPTKQTNFQIRFN